MSLTNFGLLTNEQLTVWVRDFWHEARNQSFIMSFVGDGMNAMISRVRALKPGHNGARAVLTLINNSPGDGIVGDNWAEGNEAPLGSSDCIINIDQWRYPHRSEGMMAEQKSIVDFRTEARDSAAYKAANIVDELAFLTASGVSYTKTTDGGTRVGSQLPQLAFAADVTAPSANRYYRWDAASGTLLPGATASVQAADTPSWKMLIAMKAMAIRRYIPQMRTKDGVLIYNVFMREEGIARLKNDDDFKMAWRMAEVRGPKNPLFEGTALGGKEGFYLDGLNILSYRHVYNTTGAAPGSKWGAGGTVDGQAVLLCGATALAYADLDKQQPTWVEKKFNYDNELGIIVGRRFGFKKPVFFDTYVQSNEDRGVLRIDTAI